MSRTTRWTVAVAAVAGVVFVGLSIALRVQLVGDTGSGRAMAPARQVAAGRHDVGVGAGAGAARGRATVGLGADGAATVGPRAGGRATTGEGGGGLVSGESLGQALEAARGRPAVVNVWASWCPPCRAELPLFAAAERRFGGRIAFLGADLEDDEGSARSLLAQIGIGYPSYPTDAAEVGEALGPVRGTPVIFFLGPTGEVTDEHIGAYGSAAELDADLLRHSALP